MATIVILGAGVMGSAFTVPLADNGHEVSLVGTHLDRDLIASVRRENIHPRLRAHLPESVVSYTHETMGAAIKGADLVVLGVSSAGVNWRQINSGRCFLQGCRLSCSRKGCGAALAE